MTCNYPAITNTKLMDNNDRINDFDRLKRSIKPYYTVCIYSLLGVLMGFPSPAGDFEESRISLDNRLITRPYATYFLRAAETHIREGIISGALLVVDSSLTPCDGSLLICTIDGELRIKRYRMHPVPHLINLQSGMREELPGNYYDESPVFGVITYIINDARLGEFDDCPVI